MARHLRRPHSLIMCTAVSGVHFRDEHGPRVRLAPSAAQPADAFAAHELESQAWQEVVSVLLRVEAVRFAGADLLAKALTVAIADPAVDEVPRRVFEDDHPAA